MTLKEALTALLDAQVARTSGQQLAVQAQELAGWFSSTRFSQERILGLLKQFGYTEVKKSLLEAKAAGHKAFKENQ